MFSTPFYTILDNYTLKFADSYELVAGAFLSFRSSWCFRVSKCPENFLDNEHGNRFAKVRGIGFLQNKELLPSTHDFLAF